MQVEVQGAIEKLPPDEREFWHAEVEKHNRRYLKFIVRPASTMALRDIFAQDDFLRTTGDDHGLAIFSFTLSMSWESQTCHKLRICQLQTKRYAKDVHAILQGRWQGGQDEAITLNPAEAAFIFDSSKESLKTQLVPPWEATMIQTLRRMVVMMSLPK